MKLSLCMIVKNEEDVLERCLKSIQPAVDEIIIVDTGSTDRTKEIARKFTTKVYDFKWVEDFALARNESFSKATGEYIMWLDADDIVTRENAEKIKELKNHYDPKTDIFMFQYHVAFDKNNRPTYTYYRERIIRNSEKFRWVSPIHEVIALQGNVVYTDISIEHRKMKQSAPERNLKIFNKMISSGIALDARQQFYYGRELYYNAQDIAAINTLEDFLKRSDAWYENKIDACKILGNLYQRNANKEKALERLFYSFQYAEPRSNICCEIGKIFLEQGEYKNALFWYDVATKASRENTTNAFIEPDTYDYIPYMQMCVIHYRLGNLKKASEYNELAGKIKPQDTSYLHNKKLFESK